MRAHIELLLKMRTEMIFFSQMRTRIEEMTTTQIEYGHLTKRDPNTHRIIVRDENTDTTETSSKEI